MLELFAFLIYLRDVLPPIPEATWIDQVVSVSIFMVIIAMLASAGKCATTPDSNLSVWFADSEKEHLGDWLAQVAFYMILGLQGAIIISAFSQTCLYFQRMDECHEEMAKQALVSQSMRVHDWTQHVRASQQVSYQRSLLERVDILSLGSIFSIKWLRLIQYCCCSSCPCSAEPDIPNASAEDRLHVERMSSLPKTTDTSESPMTQLDTSESPMTQPDRRTLL